MPPLPHYLEVVRRNYSTTMYAAVQAAEALKRYHRHRVVGIENVPESGAVILVTNHSFATYDGLLLGSEILRQRGRMQWALADRAFFRIPYLRDAVTRLNFVEGTRDAARRLLAEGRMLWVLPGGMREALRSRDERYQLRWGGRTGFIRLSLEAQAPIVLSACPFADDIFTLYPNRLTSLVYDRLRLPFAVLRGWGPTVLPRPVTLVHYVDVPIVPPPIAGTEATEDEVRAFHALVESRMSDLMQSSLAAAREALAAE